MLCRCPLISLLVAFLLPAAVAADIHSRLLDADAVLPAGQAVLSTSCPHPYGTPCYTDPSAALSYVAGSGEDNPILFVASHAFEIAGLATTSRAHIVGLVEGGAPRLRLSGNYAGATFTNRTANAANEAILALRSGSVRGMTFTLGALGAPDDGDTALEITSTSGSQTVDIASTVIMTLTAGGGDDFRFLEFTGTGGGGNRFVFRDLEMLESVGSGGSQDACGICFRDGFYDMRFERFVFESNDATGTATAVVHVNSDVDHVAGGAGQATEVEFFNSRILTGGPLVEVEDGAANVGQERVVITAGSGAKVHSGQGLFLDNDADYALEFWNEGQVIWPSSVGIGTITSMTLHGTGEWVSDGAPPAALCTANNVGSTYHRTDGGAATSLYVCENTAAPAWAAK